MFALNFKKIKGKIYKDLFSKLFDCGDRICISYENLSDNLTAETKAFKQISGFDLEEQVKKYYTPLEFDRHFFCELNYDVKNWIFNTNSLKELLDIYKIHEITFFKWDKLLFRAFVEDIAELYDEAVLDEETAGVVF